jgi:hypothetical protein
MHKDKLDLKFICVPRVFSKKSEAKKQLTISAKKSSKFGMSFLFFILYLVFSSGKSRDHGIKTWNTVECI